MHLPGPLGRGPGPAAAPLLPALPPQRVHPAGGAGGGCAHPGSSRPSASAPGSGGPSRRRGGGGLRLPRPLPLGHGLGRRDGPSGTGPDRDLLAVPPGVSRLPASGGPLRGAVAGRPPAAAVPLHPPVRPDLHAPDLRPAPPGDPGAQVRRLVRRGGHVLCADPRVRPRPAAGRGGEAGPGGGAVPPLVEPPGVGDVRPGQPGPGAVLRRGGGPGVRGGDPGRLRPDADPHGGEPEPPHPPGQPFQQKRH